MSIAAPMGILTNGLFSFGQRDRSVVVLKAFFDDSGTHENSDVVVMGGIVTTSEDWEAFEPPWRAMLDCYGIDKMHMSRCENGWGPFDGWDREKKERCIDAFSDIVARSKGRILASAVSRADWDQVVVETNISDWFSDPLDFLFSTCMQRALVSRRASGPKDEEIAVMFDSRDQNIKFWTDLSRGYERRWPDRLAGFSFGAMKIVLPLQAADMIAYETFVHQCDRVKNGEAQFRRPAILKILKHLDLYGGFYSVESLKAYVQDLNA
jgi:hypothetical protein